jgi:hypothetical protein
VVATVPASGAGVGWGWGCSVRCMVISGCCNG